VEQVAVNFGMAASAWLLANDTAYTEEQKRMRSEHEELSKTCGSTASSRPPTSALEEMDEEGGASPQAVQIRPAAGSRAAPAGSASKDREPAGEEEEWSGRNAVTAVRKTSLATRIKVAIDVDGDGNVSIYEALCQSSVRPHLRMIPLTPPNHTPNPTPSNPNLNPNLINPIT